MSNPLVVAYRLIWTAYGWWLPNDPRGSMSQAIRNDILDSLGKLHHGRKQLQPASRDHRASYAQAAEKLKWPLLEFEPEAVQYIADAFGEAVGIHKRF